MDAPRKPRGLKMLSFTQKEIDAVMKHTTWSDDVAQALFGDERPRERGGVPPYDELGRYPLFVDEVGRQYFDGEEYDASSTVTLFVRIPRSETAKQSKNLNNLQRGTGLSAIWAANYTATLRPPACGVSV